MRRLSFQGEPPKALAMSGMRSEGTGAKDPVARGRREEEEGSRRRNKEKDTNLKICTLRLSVGLAAVDRTLGRAEGRESGWAE